MTQWEYATIEQEVNEDTWGQQDERIYAELNDMGSHGWELVSMASRQFVGGLTRSLIFVFKRVLVEGE